MHLETERLLIRDIVPEDEKKYIEMASDGSLHDVGFGKNCSSWMKNWIAETQKLTDADNPASSYLAYTVALKETGEAIGSVGCSYYDDLQEIGIVYFIGAQYRNSGYAVEAAKAYVTYFFNQYNLPKLIATIREENPASWKTAEKAGFRFVEKKKYKDINDDKEELYRFYEIQNPNHTD